MNSLAPVLRSKRFRVAASVVAIIAVYAVMGFKVAPSILRTQAIDYVRTTYGRELAIGALAINPFSLRLEARDIGFPDSDGRTMLGARAVIVDFELSSLWRRAYTFKEVAITAPILRVVRRADGRFNLADLASRSSAPHEAEASAPSIWLESFNMQEGSLEYDDLAREQPLTRRLAPLALALKDFHTTAEGGGFALDARSPQGERVRLRGRLALTPNLAYEGELSAIGLRATGIAEIFGEALPFAVTQGTINLTGRVRSELADTLELQLDADSELDDMAIRAKDARDDWITIPTTRVTGVHVALPAQQASIAQVKIEGARAQTWVEADGALNLTRLLGTDNEASPSNAATPTTPRRQTTPAWQVDVARFDANVAALEFEDRARARGRKINIAPLDVTAEHASLDLSKPIPIRLAAKIDGQATLSVSGSLAPKPLAATLDVGVDQLPIVLLQPYALPQAALTVERGFVAANGKLALQETSDAQIRTKFAGRASLTGFESIDNALRQDFINFARIDVESIDLSLFPDALEIARINVKNPYARVVISPERILNVSAVLDPEGAEQLRRERAQRAADEETGSKPRPEKASKVQKEGATVAARDAPDATMPIRIREVRVDGGRMNFSDLSVEPNFSAEIRGLRGVSTRLSTARSSRANVRLTGNVGKFSPVSIAGTVQPFTPQTFTDVSMRFENISLPIFNPYSGRFAGYNIAKGALTTELHYRVQAKRLNAEHHIRIEQLEWGEATPERGEATLPVKFATALLRDRHGVINLDIPVSGTLDDPAFRIGPIVWQVFKNVITKAVTAPFTLLGSLFKGSEDAQFVDFPPGQAALQQATLEKIQALSKALHEKPELALDVPIGGVSDMDKAALIDERYRAELAHATRTELDLSGGAPVPAFEALEPRQKQDVLKVVVRRLTGAVPRIPEPPPAQEGLSREESKARREAAAEEFLEREAHAAINVQPSDLDRLAQQRAESVQRALLEGSQLEPTRVFLVKNDKVTSHEGKVRFELGLK